MVREADATALVADAAQALARRGYDPVITDANSVRLVRLGALMLAEFGCGRETEDDDG
jgi:O-methyltransferase involved in polyketide biosynthesis